ncbi:MAG: DUF3124 domain-containing protein [Crocinitomicaceae bacterium]|nr:DUF3124 domain-containing protein [Crocinitomicaceae bacterium]
MKNSKLVLIAISFVSFSSCGEGPLEPGESNLLPSEKYHYTDQQLADLNYHESVYVPVYSDIYHLNGERRFLLTITLSVRNVRMDESVYISHVDYYDSQGEMIRKYLEKPIELKPLQSAEFVVEHDESEGGAGANFIVGWSSDSKINPPVIQAVMIGTSSQQGISFVTNGVPLEKKTESDVFSVEIDSVQ